MKHYGKFLLNLLALCLAMLLLVSCGGSTADTDNESVTESDTETESETEGQSCDHSSFGVLEEKASTCTEKGWKKYGCLTCDETWTEETGLVAHQFVTASKKGVSLPMDLCGVCGSASVPLSKTEEIEFDAYCEGDVTVEFAVTGGSAKVAFMMDGMALSNKTYEEGTHRATIMKGLPTDEYSFGVKNNGNGHVEINKIDIDGHINIKNSVILELRKKDDTKGTYEDFFVYVRTSDPSGKYYIRYNFIYEYSTEIRGDKGNTTDNVDAFRVKTASLVEITEVTLTDIKYNTVCQVLQQGEISLAIKESGAVDFVGGYHGDDHMTSFVLSADGKEYVPGEENRIVECSYITIFQEATITRCGAPDTDVMIHTQNNIIDSTGVKNNKSVEWLVDDFKVDKGYLQMFTLYRTSGDKTVCETVSTYDAEGKLLGSETVNGTITDPYTVLSSNKIKEVHYTSATSGVSAFIGYDILDNSVVLKNGSISIRQYNDNKWYPNFRSPINGDTPKVGEVWKIVSYFDIDYTKPVN